MSDQSDSIDPIGGLESELYRVLAESAPDAILAIDEDSIILSANAAVERLFGYAADEVIGQPLSLLMPERLRGAHYAGIARYAGTGVRHISWLNIRVPILTKSGTEIPVEISFGEFVANGRRVFSGFLRDVSDRVAAEHALHSARTEAEDRASEAEQLAARLQEQATELEQQTEEAQALAEELEQTNSQLHEALLRADVSGTKMAEILEALQRSEQRYRALVEASTLMVWSADANGMVEDMPFWRELTGQTLEEVRGSGWANAIHADDRASTLDTWQQSYESRTGYSTQYRVRLANGNYHWYSARGIPISGADGEIREWVGVFNDIDDEIRRDVGARFLGGASVALAESRSERDTLDTIALLSIEGLADGCMITVVAPDGSFEHVSTRSRVPELAELVMEMERKYPLRPDAVSGHPRVIRTGEPELVRGGALDTIILDAIAYDGEHLDMLRRVGMYSGMVVPLTARGRTLGAITLVRHGPGRRSPFDEQDLTIASELGRRAGLALENARAYGAEQTARTDAERAAALSRRLQAITAAFAHVLSMSEVAETTLSQGLDALSAQAGVVYRVNGAEGVLEAVGSKGLPADVMEQWGRIALDASAPASDALQRHETLYFRERFDAVAKYPVLADAREVVETDAWVFVPLFHGDYALGTVGLGFDGPRSFSTEDRALIDALGRHCAQAMERARLLEAERAAREEAERANRTRSEFLATMSHELRTPLNAIAGYVELIEMGLRGAVTELQRDDLARIRRSQQRLLSLVNDVLSFARIDAGQVSYEITDLSLHELISGIESLVLPQLRTKGLAYQFNSTACELTVRADRARLEQILLNLLSNAVKFTPTGGTISVACEAQSNSALVHVIDTGMGIPEEKLSAIFDPFVQVESGHTRTAEGTGLGLAISRELAAGMGATVSVQSEVGISSTFTVTLPLANQAL